MSNSISTISRRGLLKGGLLALGATLLGCSSAAVKKARSVASRISMPDFGPIARTRLTQKTFSGDDPVKAHHILWSLDKGTEKGRATSLERKKVVIVGGGLSGLVSAYLLRDFEPIVLEQATRFGGNARGESLSEIDYSIGAAYISKPEVQSSVGKLLTELGLFGKWKEKNFEDAVEWDNKKVSDVWSLEKNESSHRLKSYFEKLYRSENIPALPFYTRKERATLKNLDQTSFLLHARKKAGGKLPPAIESYLENYCRSSFGASASEVSAAAGLNFFSGEFSPICYFPGGNAAITEKLTQVLYESLPENSLRADSTVTQVRVIGDGVEVSYLKGTAEVYKVVADQVVLACPKFVVKHILAGMEPERIKAIEQIDYRAYAVANVLFDRAIPQNFYDLYFLSQVEQGLITDVIHGGTSQDGKRSVLTLYSPLAYASGRGKLFSETFESLSQSVESQLEKKILPFLGLAKQNILDIRLTRWGHPLPVAKTGIFTSGLLEEIRKPFQNRVYFVEQDNWCLPAFETCVGEAYHWAPQIRSALKKNLS